jgi:UDP-N-acetylglucosamine acyltransferase
VPKIHPSAIVEPGAELADDVFVDAYARIGPHARVGAGTTVHHGAMVIGWTTVGERNQIHPYSCVGVIPQDKKYRGERAELYIGNDNVIREHVTISIGTGGGGGATRLGNRNLLMSTVHVGHDCVIGDDCVLASGAGLAGHCILEDFSIVAGQAGIHQFVHVGAHAMIGGGSKVGKDIPPFSIAQGYPARLRGINMVGLKRRGFTDEAIRAVKQAYRAIFVVQEEKKVEDSIARVRGELGRFAEVQTFLKFLEASIASERGFTHAARADDDGDDDVG